MKAYVGVAVLSAVAMACGGDSQATVADDLQRDLEASASSIELAGQAGARPMQFVSELEQGRGAEDIQRAPQPRRVASRVTGHAPEDQSSPAPETAQDIQTPQAAAEVSETPQPTPEAPSVPMVAPRPVSLPVDVPADGYGRGAVGSGSGDYGTGVGIGDVIGVVIRGGGVGPDHCPPPRRRPPRIPGRSP
jgi:hypothetical protein